MHRTLAKLALGSVLLSLAIGTSFASTTDFTGFVPGSVNYQGPGSTTTTPYGYVIPDPYGSLWTVADQWGRTKTFDEEVQDDGTGNLVWRFSNAVTTTSFARVPTTPSSPEVAGESTAFLYNDKGPDATAPVSPPNPRAGATTPWFHASFRFRSATGGAQPGLYLTARPVPRQSSYTMSYLGIGDRGHGLALHFLETKPGQNFKEQTIASGLSYADWHQVDLYIEFVDGLNADGSGNDVVSVYVDGVLVHTGTTWESYYAEELAPQPWPIAVDAIMFRASGPAVPSTKSHGLFLDDVVVDNAPRLRTKKATVLADLEALLPTGNPKDDERIGHAVEALEKSLDPTLWASEGRLTEKGNVVFDDEKRAVKELSKVVDTDVSATIDSLVAIDMGLARVAVDGVDCSADPCTRELDKANAELGKAAHELADGRPDKAIDHCKKAWHHAGRAADKPPR